MFCKIMFLKKITKYDLDVIENTYGFENLKH